jgi:chromate transporter
VVETDEGGISSRVAAAEAQAARKVGLFALFLLFSRLGLSSFGGNTSAWIHREFVEQRQLVGQSEFIAALGLCRIMPGATVVNLAVVIGRQLRGGAGACAAVLGLLLSPSLAVVAFAIIYRRFAGAAAFHTVLEGAAAASVGLMIAMGVSIGTHLIGVGGKPRRSVVARIAVIAVTAATFILIGVVHLPMVPTILCLAPVSIGLARFLPAARPSEQRHGGG